MRSQFERDVDVDRYQVVKLESYRNEVATTYVIFWFPMLCFSARGTIMASFVFTSDLAQKEPWSNSLVVIRSKAT